MEGSWESALSHPEVLSLFGWSDLQHIVGLASLVSKPTGNQQYSVRDAAAVLDAHSIPLEQRVSLLKRVTTDRASGAFVLSPAHTGTPAGSLTAPSPLRAGSNVVNWVSAPERLASRIQYTWFVSVRAFWCGHNGQLLWPELSSSGTELQLIPPSSGKSYKDALRVLVQYGNHNAGQPNHFGVLTDVQLPLPTRVHERRAPYKFDTTVLKTVKNESNKGRVYATEALLPRLTGIFEASLYATNEGIRESQEIASEIRSLFQLVKTAPSIHELHDFLSQAFGPVYDSVSVNDLPHEYRFPRLHDATQGFTDSAAGEFHGQQSLRSLRVLSQLLRGEIRFQYEQAYELVHPSRPRFQTEEDRHALIPEQRDIHAAAHLKAEQALYSALHPKREGGGGGRGGGRNGGRGNGGRSRGGGRGRGGLFRGGGRGGRGRASSGGYSGGYATQGGGEHEERVIELPDDTDSSSTGGGRGRGRGGGRGGRGRGRGPG